MPPPQRPVDTAEAALIQGILSGQYPPQSKLPGERRLVEEIGVTRPTLREALRRLEQDSWVTVQHGKATVVNDVLREGGINIISTLTRQPEYLPPNLVTKLLQVRTDIAPSYTVLAAQNNPKIILDYLKQAADLPNDPAELAKYDWELHRLLCVASDNPVYTLIMNGFSGFYEQMARHYFARPDTWQTSRPFYQELNNLIEAGEFEMIREFVRRSMWESAEIWTQVEPLPNQKI